MKAVLFAVLAERLGVREEWIELPPQASAGDVLAHYRPKLGEGGSILLAVNAEFSAPEAALHDGDEVALLPPMSGGAPMLVVTALVRQPLPPPPPWAGGAHGAVVTFEGVVRADADSGPVKTLFYEAYDLMAERRMAALAASAAEKWPLTHIHVLHRLGEVPVGEVSVRVIVASGHRDAAFAACRFLIDTLKASVPIWKREDRADGSRWVEGEPPR
ncbi:MAG TPA: molybdenum cofactor biosynthesis protein MoaE [Terriglobales bacterium]|nr:molybdenum cofactor biosynthesis protein MoaE [Terriglobales bacterium]